MSNSEMIDDVFAELESAEKQSSAEAVPPPQQQQQVPQPQARAQQVPQPQHYHHPPPPPVDDGTIVGVPRGYLPYAGMTSFLVFLGSMPFVKNMISSTPFISSLGSFAHSTILAFLAFFTMWVIERYQILR